MAGKKVPTPRDNPRRDPDGYRIDVNRPALKNRDGSISTEETATFGENGQYYNIPTIVNGKRLSFGAAYRKFRKGKNPPVQGPFKSVEEAEAAATRRSSSIPRARATKGPDR